MTRSNYYDILGVQPSATHKEIVKAYRKKALECHPDKNPNGEALFKKVGDAYAMLSDKTKRAEYDEKLMKRSFKANGRPSGGSNFGRSSNRPPDVSVSEIIKRDREMAQRKQNLQKEFGFGTQQNVDLHELLRRQAQEHNRMFTNAAGRNEELRRQRENHYTGPSFADLEKERQRQREVEQEREAKRQREREHQEKKEKLRREREQQLERERIRREEETREQQRKEMEAREATRRERERTEAARLRELERKRKEFEEKLETERREREENQRQQEAEERIKQRELERQQETERIRVQKERLREQLEQRREKERQERLQQQQKEAETEKREPGSPLSSKGSKHYLQSSKLKPSASEDEIRKQLIQAEAHKAYQKRKQELYGRSSPRHSPKGGTAMTPSRKLSHSKHLHADWADCTVSTPKSTRGNKNKLGTSTSSSTGRPTPRTAEKFANSTVQDDLAERMASTRKRLIDGDEAASETNEQKQESSKAADINASIQDPAAMTNLDMQTDSAPKMNDSVNQSEMHRRRERRREQQKKEHELAQHQLDQRIHEIRLRQVEQESLEKMRHKRQTDELRTIEQEKLKQLEHLQSLAKPTQHNPKPVELTSTVKDFLSFIHQQRAEQNKQHAKFHQEADRLEKQIMNMYGNNPRRETVV